MHAPHNFSLPAPGRRRFSAQELTPSRSPGVSRNVAYLVLGSSLFWAAAFIASCAFRPAEPASLTTATTTPSAAKWESRPSPIRLHLVQYTVHDADTLTQCQIHLGWDLYQAHRSIRFVGFDAREVSKQRQTDPPVTDTETRLGQQDRDQLAKWLSAGEVFVEPAGMSTDGRRLQGRILRYRDGQWQDAVEWMRSQGIPERS